MIENINFEKVLGLKTDYKFPNKEYFLNLEKTPVDASMIGFNG